MADPGGTTGMHPSNGTQFFCFHIRFLRKVLASEVGAPNGSGPPTQREILDPQLQIMLLIKSAHFIQ